MNQPTPHSPPPREKSSTANIFKCVEIYIWKKDGGAEGEVALYVWEGAYICVCVRVCVYVDVFKKKAFIIPMFARNKKTKPLHPKRKKWRQSDVNHHHHHLRIGSAEKTKSSLRKVGKSRVGEDRMRESERAGEEGRKPPPPHHAWFWPKGRHRHRWKTKTKTTCDTLRKSSLNGIESHEVVTAFY